MKRLRLLSLLVLLVAGLVGCGVPGERSARVIPTPGAPFHVVPSNTPAATQPGVMPETLFLVKDNTLVKVTRRVREEPTVDTLVQDLIAGPTNIEKNDGLTSALLNTDVIGKVQPSGNLVTVEIAAGLIQGGRNDQVLALAQLVCTLDSHPGVRGVTFTRNQKVISVPRADGSLSAGPLTIGDYESLISK